MFPYDHKSKHTTVSGNKIKTKIKTWNEIFKKNKNKPEK